MVQEIKKNLLEKRKNDLYDTCIFVNICRVKSRVLLACAHLIDCWARSALERWTEYEKTSMDAVCLSLLWRKSRQNGTGSSHPDEGRGGKRDSKMMPVCWVLSF